MINYIIGDATKPKYEGIKIIAHCVNDIGVFGSGFAGALNKIYPKVREKYLEWFKCGISVGDLLVVPVEKEIFVANLVGQNGIISSNNPKPVNYNGLFKAMCNLDMWIKSLNNLNFFFSINKKSKDVSIHCPRIASGLTGGDWKIIESLINVSWSYFDIYVYDMEK